MSGLGMEKEMSGLGMEREMRGVEEQDDSRWRKGGREQRK